MKEKEEKEEKEGEKEEEKEGEKERTIETEHRGRRKIPGDAEIGHEGAAQHHRMDDVVQPANRLVTMIKLHRLHTNTIQSLQSLIHPSDHQGISPLDSNNNKQIPFQ